MSPRQTTPLLWLLWIIGLPACSGACTKPLPPSPKPDLSVNGRLRIVRALPHDASAFTQGLHYLDGKIYESTGLLGRSTLRRVDLGSGVIEQRIALPNNYFGEGLAQVGQRLFQLTWTNQRVLVWDLATFKKVAEIPYEGEGWGLCFDGKRLVMSDGSDRLSFRDSSTFKKAGEIAVRSHGRPLPQLNELECVNGLVFANIWQDRHIAVIQPKSGEVVSLIDATPLFENLDTLGPQGTNQMDVLNGIAYLPQNGHFLLTGKLWPRLYEVILEH